MAVDRKQVEAVAFDAYMFPNGTHWLMSAEVLAELCRAWLALDAAPVVDVTDCNSPKRQLPNSPIGVTWDDFPTIKCRIVPEPATTASGGPRDGWPHAKHGTPEGER